jgi:hypothetical protein
MNTTVAAAAAVAWIKPTSFRTLALAAGNSAIARGLAPVTTPAGRPDAASAFRLYSRAWYYQATTIKETRANVDYLATSKGFREAPLRGRARREMLIQRR